MDGPAATTETAQSRHMWQVLEPIHFVVYLTPEIADRYRALGLKGFWMGYFASRSHPLGPVPAEVVTATFFWFHPAMVRRALPDAWRFTTPGDVARAQVEGVDAALGRVLGERIGSAELAEAADLAMEAVAGCGVGGRPLFAAHAALPWPQAAHLRLWHAATLLREHRGDGHIAASLANGLDGLAAHLTNVASGAVPRQLGQLARGWNDDEWAACETRLESRGWLADGKLTDAGHRVRAAVEQVTDELAAEPWRHLGNERSQRLAELVLPFAQALMDAGVMPRPNPIGVRWPPSLPSGRVP